MSMPHVVSPEQWQTAVDELRVKEKAAMGTRDALAAERRRLPMVRIESDYSFDGREGKAHLRDLFAGRRQLIVYHFMFAPGVEGWPTAGCVGCSFFVDSVAHLAHLHERDTSFVLVSRAPLANIEPYRARMGWSVPWFSSSRSDFNADFGVTIGDRETFALSVFFRDGGAIYRSYVTTGRGVEGVGGSSTLLDLTPLGRQEQWEDSPAGWPQMPPWWRRHDEYEDRTARTSE